MPTADLASLSKALKSATPGATDAEIAQCVSLFIRDRDSSGNTADFDAQLKSCKARLADQKAGEAVAPPV